jgi:Sjoegren syndrome nuclear autoantigen 1
LFDSSGWIFEARTGETNISKGDHTLRRQHFRDHQNMAGQGASLQNFNNELVKCIEDLREKREEINRQLLKDEEDKAKIQRDLSVLTDRLAKINESLARKVQARNEYDRTIQETEGAYMKILESSATLLNVLKRETVALVKKKT